MTAKTIFSLFIFALLIAMTSYAEPSSTDMDKLSYCYGVYSATKDKSEVDKSNLFLVTANDTYTKITGKPSFQQGYNQAATLDKKQKSSCYMIVYGFLGVGYAAAGQKDTKSDLDLAYCMGYVNEARGFSDDEMMQEFCAGAPAKEKTRCLSESLGTLAHNPKYQTGRREAHPINPIRVMKCGMKLMSATEQDFINSMESKKHIATPQKKKPQGKKDTLTTPIFH